MFDKFIPCMIRQEIKEKEKDMGLDQIAGLRDENGEVQDKFYWRKHARLQVFFAKEFEKQKGDSAENTFELGFNGGDGGVEITKELLDRLKEQKKNDYYNCFANDGFFWGQQFQEEQVKAYAEQDQKFIEWAEKEIEKGNKPYYDCSW